jgi:translation initiation factor 2 subunit 2
VKMSDNEPDIFDPNLKRKKKKKKTTFDTDGLIGDNNGVTETPSTTENSQTFAAELADDAEKEQAADFDDDFSTLSKKKKKKKTMDMSDVGAALPKEDNNTVIEDDSVDKQDDGVAAEQEDDDIDFGLAKKKKKKAKAPNADTNEGDKEQGNDLTSQVGGQTWEETDRDYTYDELLKRVFDIMREKNPDMVAGEKKRIIMKPPQVMRVGTKKSSFSNFVEICKMLHRQPKHLLAFLLAELGTSGSLDGTSQLIIKGRFQQKQIESVLRRYIKEYVTCHTCRSPDTLLQKDTRLYFLQCETCGSRCSVASIKSGFQAVTSKRAAIRAKTA